jgi:aspartyl-tRNA(Asn)/glutamyl-tRNA(Gln) amidotransferase subunit A
MFPLVATMDTVGPLTKSAEDAAITYSALTGQPKPVVAPLKRLRFGKPENYFYDNLDQYYQKCMNAALADLEKAGADIVPVEVPEASERESYFPVALPAYALGVLGMDRFLKIRDKMDPIVEARCASGLDLKAAEFIRVELRRHELWRIARRRKNFGFGSRKKIGNSRRDCDRQR